MTKQPMDAVAGEASPVAIAIDQEDSEMTEDIQLPDGAISDETRKALSDQQITSQYRENLAHNMRRFRAREGWTQTDLGRAIGSSQAQIAFLEREKQNVGLGMLTKLAVVFNVEPMVLISPPDNLDDYYRRRGIMRPHDRAWADSTLINPAQASAKSQQDAAGKTPEEKSSEPQTSSASAVPKPSEAPASAEVLFGSPGEPLDLVVMARIVGAAYKRIESLRHKHGSVPMTRAMLNSVLAAVLNASHETDDEYGKDGLALPEVDC